MSRVVAVLLAVLAMFGCAVAADASRPLQYDLKAVIEPAAGTVAVRGSMQVGLQNGTSQLSFKLHRTFAITHLAVNGKKADFSYQAVEPTPFNPATRNVIVALPAGVAGKLSLDIAYNGKLEEIPEWGTAPDQKLAMDDQVNARMVQLASYSSWYPQFGAFGGRFGTDLEVSLPKGWVAVSGGAKRDEVSRDGRAVTHWAVPDNFDITISAAPGLRLTAVRATGAVIEIYHTQMPNEVIAHEAKDLSAVMQLFEDRLGQTSVPGGAIRHVYLPMQHGQGRAGIARSGIIITSEGRVLAAMAKDPNYSLFQDIAHEIAHFWWNFGSGQGDWVNEAFAEYFSALAVRSLVSEQQFESIVETYNSKVGALPADASSLATVPAQGGNWTVRYLKSSLMLDDFRHVLGDESFFQASRDFYQTYTGRPVGTSEFRSFWRARMGSKAARVDAWLDTAGGVPASL